MIPSDENLYLQRIRRISHALAHVCPLLMITLPLAVAGYWLMADAAQLVLRVQLPASAVHTPLQNWQRAAGALIMLLPVTLLSIGLAHARRCFRLFAVGDVFNASAVRCLQRFAGWVMVSVAVSMVAVSAISVVLTLNNPQDMRHLAISIGTDQIFTLFFAGMVWLMAAVIGQGQLLAEENASIV